MSFSILSSHLDGGQAPFLTPAGLLNVNLEYSEDVQLRIISKNNI